MNWVKFCQKFVEKNDGHYSHSDVATMGILAVSQKTTVAVGYDVLSQRRFERLRAF